MEKQSDKQLRKKLIPFLLTRDEPSVIINEMGLFKGDTIADLVTVVRGDFNCYEIKSDKDTLARLEGQMSDYEKVFDHITLVVSSKFQDKILEKIPEWYGVLVIKDQVEIVREPTKNPLIDQDYYCNLLWRDECYQLLTEQGVKGYSGKRKQILEGAILRNISHETTKQFLLGKMESRDWRGQKDRVIRG